MTHYQTLGLHQDASAHAIKMAYRKLVKIYHPDRGAELPAGAEEKMRQINEAYAVLSKPSRRREYDSKIAVGMAEPKYSHPTGEAGRAGTRENYEGPERRSGGRATNVKWKSRSEELNEEIVTPGFLKRFRTEYGNRLESKDAFLAVLLAFFLMMKQPAYFANFGNLLVSWPFFGAALFVAIGVRFIAASFAAKRFKTPDGFGVIVVSNVAAAFALGAMAKVIEGFLQQQLFAFPIIPAMLMAILPGSFGAGMGRAFNRSVDPFYGVIGGALVGAGFALFFGLWAVLAQLAVLGPLASSPDSAILAKPFKAVLVAAAVSGALGSFRVNYLFIFSIFDWIETWFERFRPLDRVESSVLTRRD